MKGIAVWSASVFALVSIASGCGSSHSSSPVGGNGGASNDGGGGERDGGNGGANGGHGNSNGGGGAAGASNDAAVGGTGAEDAGPGADAQANDAGVPRDAGGDGATSTDVTVTVKGFAGPVSNLPVLIDGVTHVTDAAGTFTAHGVGATYDATTIYTDSQGATQVHVYLGLTTRSPVIGVTSAVTVRSATVSGQLSGGTGFPNGASSRALVSAVVPGDVLALASFGASEGPAYDSLNLRWAGATSIDARLFALQWTVDGNGLPTGYDGFATKTLSVSDGGNFGKSDGSTPSTNLDLGAVSSRNLNGTAAVPAGFTIGRKVLYAGGIVGAAQLVNDPASATAYQYRVPSGLSPVELNFRVFADGANGEGADTSIRVDDSTANLDLALLDPPVPVLPLDGATGVDYATEFTFTASPGAVHGIQCWETAGTTTFNVYTTGDTVKIPDLTAAGVPLKRNTSYTWAATVDGPATTVEDVLPRPIDFFELHGRRSNAFSAERTFTVAQ